MKKEEILTTKRILLRPFHQSDLGHLTEMLSDEVVMRPTGFRSAQSSERTQELLTKWIGEGQQELGVWAAQERSSGEFVGWFMLKKTTSADPEIGFMLPQSQWAKGYASEVSAALLHYAFVTLKVSRVIAKTLADNFASRRVLEKIGMRLVQESPDQDNLISYEMKL